MRFHFQSLKEHLRSEDFPSEFATQTISLRAARSSLNIAISAHTMTTGPLYNSRMIS